MDIWLISRCVSTGVYRSHIETSRDIAKPLMQFLKPVVLPLPGFLVCAHLAKSDDHFEERGRPHKLRNSPQARGLQENGVELESIRWVPYWHYSRKGMVALLACVSFNYPTTPASANTNHLTYIDHSHPLFRRLLSSLCISLRVVAPFGTWQSVPNHTHLPRACCALITTGTSSMVLSRCLLRATKPSQLLYCR
jgi:hypothetical protein